MCVNCGCSDCYNGDLCIKNYKIPDDLYCPFCNLCEFDAIGLKDHLLSGDCKPFNEIEIL